MINQVRYPLYRQNRGTGVEYSRGTELQFNAREEWIDVTISPCLVKAPPRDGWKLSQNDYCTGFVQDEEPNTLRLAEYRKPLRNFVSRFWFSSD